MHLERDWVVYWALDMHPPFFPFLHASGGVCWARVWGSCAHFARAPSSGSIFSHTPISISVLLSQLFRGLSRLAFGLVSLRYENLDSFRRRERAFLGFVPRNIALVRPRVGTVVIRNITVASFKREE